MRPKGTALVALTGESVQIVLVRNMIHGHSPERSKFAKGTEHFGCRSAVVKIAFDSYKQGLLL